MAFNFVFYDDLRRTLGVISNSRRISELEVELARRGCRSLILRYLRVSHLAFTLIVEVARVHAVKSACCCFLGLSVSIEELVNESDDVGELLALPFTYV